MVPLIHYVGIATVTSKSSIRANEIREDFLPIPLTGIGIPGILTDAVVQVAAAAGTIRLLTISPRYLQIN